jgi:hypothetical protein
MYSLGFQKDYGNKVDDAAVKFVIKTEESFVTAEHYTTATNEDCLCNNACGVGIS